MTFQVEKTRHGLGGASSDFHHVFRPHVTLTAATDGLGWRRRHHPGRNLVTATLGGVFPFLKDKVLLSQMNPSGAFQAAGLGKGNFLFFFLLFHSQNPFNIYIVFVPE